jgi:hypothetical protein
MSDSSKLVSMKLPKEKAEAERYPTMQPPEYPWGLQITLENEQLKALGLSTLPAVGSTMTITAKVEVCSVSQYESQRDDDRRSVGLQITDLALG